MRKSRSQLFDHNTRRVELLTTPVDRLEASMRKGLLGKCLRRFKEELEREKFILKPQFYLSDEYGCVAGTANIALGFWDTDEDLRALYKESGKVIDDEKGIMQYLRHEMGHAFCYSYKLYRDKEFRRLFKVKGHFFHTYPKHDRFKPKRWSRDFVNPEKDHYAQKHPDDDFAETFAVWMDRSTRWRTTYKHKPGALRKLKYVNETVRKLKRKQPSVENDRDKIDLPINDLHMTLGRFLGISPRRYRRKATGYIDPDLKEMFRLKKARRGRISAFEYLKQNKRIVSEQLLYWISCGEYALKDLIDKMLSRLRALDLYFKKEESQKKLIELMCYLTVLLMNYELTGRYLPKSS